jgi:hypothetical protein
MFRGQYQPAFYRQLHHVVHQEFRLHKATTLASQMWRRPTQLTLNNVRRLLAAAGRWPLLGIEKTRLQRLKVPNQQASTLLTGA